MSLRQLFTSGVGSAARAVGARLPHVMPAPAYAALALRLYPAFNPARRGAPHITVTRVNDMYRVADGTTTLHIAHIARLNRYIWPQGIAAIGETLLNKYQDEIVSVNPGDVVLDVGANVGEFALAIADRAATVHCVEPDPKAYACLVANTHGLTHVNSHNMAIGLDEGRSMIYLATADADSSLIAPRRYDTTVEVQSKRLSDIIRDDCAGRVDFLKMDAEGAEPEVVESGGSELAGVRKVAVDCSAERKGMPTAEAVEKQLRDAGFAYVHRREDGAMVVVLGHR